MRHHLLSFIAVTAATLSGCSTTIPATQVPISLDATASQLGTLVSFDFIDELDQAKLQQTASELPGEIKVKNSVRLYRLVYRSQIKGQNINASALIAVPKTNEPLGGLVLYLRGSDIHRSAAPTTPNAIWTTEAAVYGGNGFAVVIPDYIGFGAAPSPQAFLLTDENVADFRAALTAAKSPLQLRGTTSLFVTGFSQGGQLSAALHRDLEARPLRGFNLRTTVAIAGPHELVNTFARRLEEPLARDPVAMGYVAWAAYTFAWQEGRPLDTVFAPKYANQVANWFGGSMTPVEIFQHRPEHTAQLFTPEFLEALKSDNEFWFNRLLRASETHNWVPRKPLRVVVGSADRNVDPVSTRILYERAKARGGNVSMLEFPGLDHQETSGAAHASTLRLFQDISMRRATPI